MNNLFEVYNGIKNQNKLARETLITQLATLERNCQGYTSQTDLTRCMQDAQSIIDQRLLRYTARVDEITAEANACSSMPDEQVKPCAENLLARVNKLHKYL